MKKIKRLVFFGFALSLTGACVPTPPVVTDYNGASVTIQQDILLTPANGGDPAVISEASRICGTAGRRAEYASTVTDQRNYIARHLFLCL